MADKKQNFTYSSVVGRSSLPFQFFIGMRGVGKTYSALKHCATRENEEKFILLRRTERDMERLFGSKASLSPFKKINNNEGLDIDVEYTKSEGFGLIYNISKDTADATGEERYPIGYTTGLSVFSGLRGADFSDADLVVFDEFIPEEHVTQRTSLGSAFLHFYETINRNRELDGKDPLRVIFLANSIKLNNDILAACGIISVIADMQVKGLHKYSDEKRGIYIELVENEAFKEAKENTALYRMTGDNDFKGQAIGNQFMQDDFRSIKQIRLQEYSPIMCFGVYTIYQHRSRGYLYICKKTVQGVEHLKELDMDILYWRLCGIYRLAQLQRKVQYDEYTTKLVFDSIFYRRTTKI